MCTAQITIFLIINVSKCDKSSYYDVYPDVNVLSDSIIIIVVLPLIGECIKCSSYLYCLVCSNISWRFVESGCFYN